MMAATASWRDDTAGATVTTGTANVYAISTFSAFDTLPHLGGQMIAFTPHATNTGSTTLAVDGLAAKPVRLSPNVELPSGVLIQGTPYLALYNNSDGVFYLHALGGSQAFGIPLGGGMDYWVNAAPSSSFALAYGQAISRTVYANLFALMGNTFGVGDGSTTFNLPDLRGRVRVAADNMGGTAAGRSAGYTYAVAGGEQNHVLTQAELPAAALSVSASGGVSVSSTIGTIARAGGIAQIFGGSGGAAVDALTYNTAGLGTVASTGSASVSGTTSNLGSGAAHNNMQPTMACNYIIKIV